MEPQQSTSGVRIFPPAIHLGAIAVGFLIQWAAPVRFGATGRLPALIVGCLVIAMAVGLMAWSLVVMRRAGTTPNPTKPSTAFVANGPYRLTRNPMYLAWELICVGVGLAANAPWPIVMAVPAALVTRWLVIDKEERYMESKFGAVYLEYKARVRRWV